MKFTQSAVSKGIQYSAGYLKIIRRKKKKKNVKKKKKGKTIGKKKQKKEKKNGIKAKIIYKVGKKGK